MTGVDMSLDRNLGPFGKYVVFRSKDGSALSSAPFDPNECFVLLLKDKFTAAALAAYADAAEADGMIEYARQVRELVGRAGPNSRHCKRPD